MRTKPILVVAALFLSLAAFAQHNEEVTIEGSFRPTLNQGDKILLKPDTPEQHFEMPSATVEMHDIAHHFMLNLERISPLNYNTKNLQDSDAANNFLMAGIGTRISPVFLYRHNSKLSKTLGLGVGIKHYSSWLGIKDYAPSGFMNNAFEVGLTSSRFRDLLVNGNVYYKNDVIHYYGVRTDEWTGSEAALAHAAPRQTYNTVGLHAEMASTTTKLRELRHQGSIDYHYLFSRLGPSEHFVGLDYGLSYANNWWGDKNNPQLAGADFQFRVSNNVVWMQLNPYFEMRDAFYRLHLGAKVDAKASGAGVDSRVTVHPDLRGSLFVFDNRLEFYAGLNGGRKVNTYSELVGQNPFLGNIIQPNLSNVKLGFDGGLRTNVMNSLDIHFGVRYRHTDNDVFFRQLVTPGTAGLSVDQPYNTYDVIYDETHLVSVLANVRWLPMDRLSLDAGFAYNNYTMTNEAHPWYRPAVEGKLKASYQFNEDLLLNASLLYQGGRYAQHDTGLTQFSVVKLKDVFDLGLGADYNVQDEFTAFVKVDNLFHQKYQLYYDYPVTGIEFFAGIKMRF